MLYVKKMDTIQSEEGDTSIVCIWQQMLVPIRLFDWSFRASRLFKETRSVTMNIFRKKYFLL